jgi:HTH-type transcriptional regulator/antitoxin HipB
MGVYHLMGLGRSAGAITAPLSYLAHRFTRWNHYDQNFFARSGEAVQREQSQKVGDIQSIVLVIWAARSAAQMTKLSQRRAGVISAFENKAERTQLDIFFRILAALNLEIHVVPRGTQPSGWAQEW